MILNQKAFEGALAELEFAYESVPFFREHLGSLGIRPDEIRSPGDWRQVPATVKADYRRNFPAGVLARGKTLAEPNTLKSQSSGTGGERLTTVAHTYSLAQRMRATLSANRALRDALARCRHHRPARYAAPNCSDVECATPFTTMKDRILPDGTLVLPVAHDLLATPEHMVRQAIDELKTFKPHWLYVDPTHIAFLLRQMRALGEQPVPVEAIALTYTLATKVSRRQILKQYGDLIPMAEIVSMTELGWIAIECEQARLHVNNETFFAEFLVGDRPAKEGELSELVMTSIGDRLLPHVRYRTGDLYRLHGACPCGSPFPAARHEGRYTSVIWPDGGDPEGRWITPRDINDCVGECPGIAVYQLRQAPDGAISFTYIPESGPPSVRHNVEEALRELLGNRIELSVAAVDYIPAQRSGKFASCVAELAERVSAEDPSREPRDRLASRFHGLGAGGSGSAGRQAEPAIYPASSG